MSKLEVVNLYKALGVKHVIEAIAEINQRCEEDGLSYEDQLRLKNLYISLCGGAQA